MMIIVPLVEFDEETVEEIGSYIGAYNFDVSNILSIEPDENGNTCIFHKFNDNSITLKIPIEEFIIKLPVLAPTNLMFGDNVIKEDKGMKKIIEQLTDKYS